MYIVRYGTFYAHSAIAFIIVKSFILITTCLEYTFTKETFDEILTSVVVELNLLHSLIRLSYFKICTIQK